MNCPPPRQPAGAPAVGGGHGGAPDGPGPRPPRGHVPVPPAGLRDPAGGGGWSPGGVCSHTHCLSSAPFPGTGFGVHGVHVRAAVAQEVARLGW